MRSLGSGGWQCRLQLLWEAVGHLFTRPGPGVDAGAGGEMAGAVLRLRLDVLRLMQIYPPLL